MDNRAPQNQFEEVHKKVRERLARDRKTNEMDSSARKQREEEDNGKLFDRERSDRVRS
jgi:hypothetical protein